MKIALVSCVSKKQLGIHKAEELYISDWFIKAKKYIKQNYNEWYILSAKHGLIKPNDLIETYNEYLPKMTLEYRKQWAVNVFNKLKEIDNVTEIHIYAGKQYRKYLIALLSDFKVSVPLKNLGIGKQLKWLKENTL